MPPRVQPILEASPSPTPTPDDSKDFLVIQDFVDTLDQIPNELTHVHSDLNELGAVLYATLGTLEQKLHQLIDWVQDPSIGVEQRFHLLQDVAEEAAKYKLGSEDKVRVAGGACDGKNITNLLNSSTLLNTAPPSPYTKSLVLHPVGAQTSSRRGQLARAANSPFPSRGYATASAPDPKGDTPSKKKKSRVQQLGAGRDDDELSTIGSIKSRVQPKKRKPARANSPSPSDSAYNPSRNTVPQTARQIAAAAARARKPEPLEDEDDDDEPAEDSTRDAAAESLLGLDTGARPAVVPARRWRGGKRPADEEEEADGASGEDAPPGPAGEEDVDMGGAEPDVDSKAYCTCRQVSYGEMIGCDDDDCPIEWYHLACLNLDKPPEGNWLCPRCVERRKRKGIVKKVIKRR